MRSHEEGSELILDAREDFSKLKAAGGSAVWREARSILGSESSMCRHCVAGQSMIQGGTERGALRPSAQLGRDSDSSQGWASTQVP